MSLSATTLREKAPVPRAAERPASSWSPPSGGRRRVSPGLRRLVDLMDNRFEIAGIRFGFDALIGLVPGFGDFFGMILGAAVVLEALRHRIPLWVVGRMVFNLWLDAVLGSVPLVGDAFDVFFKAHRRNLKLLEESL